MGRHGEAGRPHLLHIPRTAVNIVNLVARVALEMVVMLQVGQFVPSSGPGDLHDLEGPTFHQTFQVAIDGRDPDTGDRFGSNLPDLVR